MSYNNYSYRVLCEDRRQYYLIQSFLICKGVNGRKIMLSESLPEGKGDAKQFIHDTYQKAVRNIKKNTNTVLIVARDADTEAYADVKEQFKDDNVFPVISKRNIETWFYFLDNPESPLSKDEKTDRKAKEYPKNGTQPTKYGQKLEDRINDLRNGTALPNMPDSLKQTIDHLLESEKKKRVA